MGRVVWNLPKSLWNLAFLLVAVGLGPLTFSWPALAVFGLSTGLTLCLGHSVGAHRLLIHRSFRVPLAVEHALVTLGILVGMGGPIGLVKLHNARDYFQNEPQCHPYFSVERSLFRDWLNSMHGRFEYAVPFTPRLDPAIANDAYYQWLERHWRWLQVGCAGAMWWLGGFSFVVWGVFVRVVVSLHGHWLVGFVTHRRAHTGVVADGRFSNHGSAIQGANSALFGALSMGEGWHNNHHAFPRSARIGIRWYELDPGFWVIRLLELLGVATEVLRPSLKTRYRRARLSR